MASKEKINDFVDQLICLRELLREARALFQIEEMEWDECDYEFGTLLCKVCGAVDKPHKPDCRLYKFLEDTKEIENTRNYGSGRVCVECKKIHDKRYRD